MDSNIIYYAIEEEKLIECQAILTQNLKNLNKKIKSETQKLAEYIESFAKINKIDLRKGQLTQKIIYYLDKEKLKVLNGLINARIANNKIIKRLKEIIHSPILAIRCEKCGGEMEEIPLHCSYIRQGNSYVLLE